MVSLEPYLWETHRSVCEKITERESVSTSTPCFNISYAGVSYMIFLCDADGISFVLSELDYDSIGVFTVASI